MHVVRNGCASGLYLQKDARAARQGKAVVDMKSCKASLTAG